MGFTSISIKSATSENIKPNLLNFIRKIGVSGDFSVTNIKRGRNSRVYCLSKNKKKMIIKEYYKTKLDKRDRLEAEFSFLNYLKFSNINNVATPLFKDSINDLAIYSYLNGLKPNKTSNNVIDQAALFIKRINQYRKSKYASKLGDASEACFSINAHLQQLNKRIMQLESIDSKNAISDEALKFILKKLIPKKKSIINNIEQLVPNDKINLELDNNEKILSPSDFGFQNTLIDNDKVNFLDFEYAGWDDPAKLICDFGCHPEIPISKSQHDKFKNSLNSWIENYSEVIMRSELLMPVYRLKWCCIMLNEFTNIGFARRKFSKSINSKSSEKQLNKTKIYYKMHLED